MRSLADRWPGVQNWLLELRSIRVSRILERSLPLLVNIDIPELLIISFDTELSIVKLGEYVDNWVIA